MILADLFAYVPDRQFDMVFAGFWLSHVPQRRFVEFWSSIDAALNEGGGVVLVDSYTKGLTGSGDRRRLPDGREFRIVKEEYQPRELSILLANIGWHAEVKEVSDNTYRVLARRAADRQNS